MLVEERKDVSVCPPQRFHPLALKPETNELLIADQERRDHCSIRSDDSQFRESFDGNLLDRIESRHDAVSGVGSSELA